MLPAPSISLDLRGTPCPMNFVRTKLALEDLEAGQVLELLLDPGDPVRNIPRSVKEEGHRVLSVENLGGAFRLLIEKVGE
ncbi:MAG: sulfurtransferase TusA family protein [Thermanaeromonas sp.]|uniref:sulfurtransferase TusA family protein n=1 Tax=Thermanaeromonas sp. TaxID=2003697 RepID=UPI00243CF29A|nr:sulfurtransferase TusA family protein [Thermanaeromonas sp.]MCG0277732.1 sulfurtransferase TusA family protein [Thermanaeromonas sp.]